MIGPEKEDDWRKKPVRLLVIVVVCGLALRAADLNLFDGLNGLFGIEKMPWQQ